MAKTDQKGVRVTPQRLRGAIAASDREAGRDDAAFLSALRDKLLVGEGSPSARAARGPARARTRAARATPARKLESDARQLANARKLARQVLRGTARILGGTLVTGKSFPDCVAVGGNSGWDCTGTLIAPNLVLTAGHCSRVATRVFFGNNVSRKGRIVKVARRVRHAKYVANGKKNDLMALILAENVTGVPPRALATTSLIDKAKTARLVGFGNTDRDGTYGYGSKRLVDVPVASPSCAGKSQGQTDRSAYGCHTNLEIVAGKPLLKKDSCSGDSGGPAYVLDGKGDWRLGGVTSRSVDGGAHACGDGGIYVRVDKYLDWIRSVQNGARQPSGGSNGGRKTAGRKRK